MSDKTSSAKSGGISFGDNATHNTAVSGGVSGDYVSGDKHVHEAPAPTVSALHQLPSPPRDFTGREAEIAELMATLEDNSLAIYSLQGMGGVGKTAIALKLAEKIKECYPDGQFYLDLRGVSPQPLAPAAAMSHVIHAYHPGARLPESEAELRGAYLSVLHNQRALLLMDNARDESQVEPLIPPLGCKMLVTSRQYITLPGFIATTLNSLLPADACKLLLTIAPRIGELAGEIAKLCGYLPLALRLAANAIAKRPNIRPADYARKLTSARERLSLIEASLSLSYEILSDDLQHRWRVLAVFPESFDDVAAAAVWEIEGEEAQEALGELLAFSLVEWNEAAGRYRLHDLARVFADSRLSDPERDNGRRPHARHYQTVLSAANNLYLKGGDVVIRGLAHFDQERTNIEAGQAWTIEQADHDEGAAQLCCTYPEAGVYVLDLRQHPRQRILWLETALATSRRLDKKQLQRSHLNNLGWAYAELGEFRSAIEFYEQALTIARKIGDRRGEGHTLGNMGLAYAGLGETLQAIELYEQSRIIKREIGDRRSQGRTLSNLGMAYADRGEDRRAIELYNQALAIAREFGDRIGEGNAVGNLGLAYAELGKFRRAINFYGKQLVITREIGDRRGEGHALGNMGLAYAGLGKHRRAIELYDQALAIARDVGDSRGEGNVVWNMARALNAIGERSRAIDCAEAALVIREQTEDPKTEKVRKQLAEWKAGEVMGQT